MFQRKAGQAATHVVSLLLVMALAGMTIGCGELHHRQLLGARVHSFNVGGIDFVHCSILIDRAKPQQAHDAIEVCRDEVQATPPQPLRPKPGRPR